MLTASVEEKHLLILNVIINKLLYLSYFVLLLAFSMRAFLIDLSEAAWPLAGRDCDGGVGISTSDGLLSSAGLLPIGGKTGFLVDN